MTEASHQMTSNPLPKHGPHKPGTVGRAQGSVKVRCRGAPAAPPLPHARLAGGVLSNAMLCCIPAWSSSSHVFVLPPPAPQVAILDERCQPVPSGGVGEICIQGPNVTAGYLENPKANEEAFAGGCVARLVGCVWCLVSRALRRSHLLSRIDRAPFGVLQTPTPARGRRRVRRVRLWRFAPGPLPADGAGRRRPPLRPAPSFRALRPAPPPLCAAVFTPDIRANWGAWPCFAPSCAYHVFASDDMCPPPPPPGAAGSTPETRASWTERAS